MAEDLSDIWDSYDKTFCPIYLFKTDEPVLTEEQRCFASENAFWQQLDNLEYLHRNPEIRAIIRLIFKELLTAKPYDILKHLAKYFGAPKCKLRMLIKENMEENLEASCQPETKFTSRLNQKKVEKTKAYANIKNIGKQIQLKEYQKPCSALDSYGKAEMRSAEYDRTSISLFTSYWDIGKSNILHNITYKSTQSL